MSAYYLHLHFEYERTSGLCNNEILIECFSFSETKFLLKRP
jgi:hypothetical protein